MGYFIDYIKTYANVNRKGRELQIYVQQFDHHLIEDENSLKVLKCDIERQIMVMNEKYPAAVRSGWTCSVTAEPGNGPSLWSMTATVLSA